MEIEGMIIRDLGQLEGVSKAGNPWKKHEWVLETQGQYPRKIKFTVFGDRVNTITFELGKSYNVQVDVESREFNERWYTDLTAYAARPLENVGTVQNPGNETFPGATQPVNPFGNQAAQQPATGSYNPADLSFEKGDSQEDLPF